MLNFTKEYVMAQKKTNVGTADAVKFNPDFQNREVPLFMRKRWFAEEMVLRVLFEGTRKANKWAKVNRPSDWDSETLQESKRKERAWLKDNVEYRRQRLAKLSELKAPKDILENEMKLVADAERKYKDFLERERRRKAK
jgi:hypothetical protein